MTNRQCQPSVVMMPFAVFSAFLFVFAISFLLVLLSAERLQRGDAQ